MALRSFAVRHARILAVVGVSIFLMAVIAACQLFDSYSHYASIIDARLRDKSLQQPAGIYAAPRRISVGERMTRDELVEHLTRAGYMEGDQPGEFAVGSFMVEPHGIEIRTNEFAREDNLPEVIQLSLGNGKTGTQVTEIKDRVAQRNLNSLPLPPELLTADPHARKQTHHATSFNELPRTLIAALLAIEDRRFYSHHGVDPVAIGRAFLKNLRSGGVREGASTITQQLVKNQFLTPDRTYSRKFAEAMMAIALERRLGKQQILALYCDRVYLGRSGITAIYGFKQAAQVYFGKDLNQLSLAETAFLAGLVKAPNRYTPHARPEAASARRDAVLSAMVETGAISAAEAEAARAEQLAVLPPQPLDDSAAPYFIDYLRRELARRQLGEETWPHLRIETSLDLDLQQVANQAVRENLARLTRIVSGKDKAAQPEAALVALNPHTGEILAMVGGRDYAASQFNHVTDAMRQPGSVFKPVVYAAALTRGLTPATTFVNAPHEIEFGYHAVYRPENFGRAYSGQPVMLREAVVRSLNVVAVDAAMQIGLGRVADMAERMGLPRPEAYPSLALGAFEATPLDIARAYTTFANNGIRVDPLAIRTIKRHGEVLDSSEATRTSVLSAATAYLVTDTLMDVVNRGTASRIRQLGYRGPAAGKTGTSRDGWFVGYTPDLLVAVWVGYDDHRDLGMTGGEAAVPIWTDFIKRAVALHPEMAAKKFVQPSGLELVEMDADNGTIANEFCPHRQRVLVSSYGMLGACLQHHAPALPENEEPILLELPIQSPPEAPSLEPTEIKLERSAPAETRGTDHQPPRAPGVGNN